MVPTPRPFDTRRLLRESSPAAAILLFWTVLSGIASHPIAATGLRYAGLVMVLLYVGVRGVELARSNPSTAMPDTIKRHLSENVGVAIPAAGWFLVGLLVAAIEPYWSRVGLPGLFTSPVDMLVFVFTATGVATVLLYAIAVGLPRVWDVSTTGDDAVDEPPADG